MIADRALRLMPGDREAIAPRHLKRFTRAAEAGLVVEISRRAAWKLYLTPDLAVAFGYVARLRSPPPCPATRGGA